MAAPIIYTPSFDFSDFEETQPNTPKPGVQLDSQFQDIKAAITNHRDVIKDVRRDDGALANGIVTSDSLAPDLLDELLSSSMATAAAESAAEAAESAAEAEASAESLVVASAALEAASNAFATGGLYADWGDFHSAPGTSLDWGAFH